MNDVQAANYIMQRMREDTVLRSTVGVVCIGRGFKDLFDWATRDPESLILFAEGEKDLEPVYENPDLNHIDLEDPE